MGEAGQVLQEMVTVRQQGALSEMKSMSCKPEQVDLNLLV